MADGKIGDRVKALVFDVFGTVVDWRSSVIRDGEKLTKELGVQVDWPTFAEEWRRKGYHEQIAKIRSGEAPYETTDVFMRHKLDEMIPVGLNRREVIECNWKVVMDAFQEGYHIQGVHPELIPAMDESKERYFFYGDHSVATGPFGASNLVELGPEALVDVIRNLTATFPAVAEALPRFEELVDEMRGPDGVPQFTPERGGRELLQQATRETWSNKGLDVSGLTDIQMADNHFHLVFPNLFMTIRAGEATMIMSAPLEDNDPNKCTWHVMNLMWVPPEQRKAMREPLKEVGWGEHEPYFLALEQDYDQMQRQQAGLRNTALKEMALTRQEVRLAWFHSALDSWVYGRESK